VVVDELRDYLFAATALPRDEHGGIGRRDFPGELDRPTEGRCRAEECELVGRHLRPVERVLLLARLARHQQGVHRAADQDLQVRSGEGLRKVVERALPQCLHARLDARVPGHHDHDRVAIGPERRAQQRQPVDLGHVEIHQHHVKGTPLQQLQRILTAAADSNVVPFVPQYGRAAFAQCVLVVDHENPHASLRFRSDRQ
jgi:hypothetical protein